MTRLSKQHQAGHWCVAHCYTVCGIEYADPVTRFYPTEQEASAVREQLLAEFKVEYPKFPDHMRRVVRKATITESREALRWKKQHRLFGADFHIVTRKLFNLVNGKPEYYGVEELSPVFASRFAAVKALRVARRKYPTAKLTSSNHAFINEADRDAFLRKLVRAGERP